MRTARFMPAAAGRIWGLVKYNKDWLSYLLRRSRDLEAETFRLRNGQVVTLHHDARWTLNEVFRDRVYDVPGVDLSTCRTILDVGANAGIFSLFAASVAPGASIHAFEPDAANFSMLRRNVEANRGRILFHQAAMGETDGHAYLARSSTSVSHALAETGEQRVELVSLEHAVDMCGGAVDFLKMDVEGAEVDIMRGCPDAVYVASARSPWSGTSPCTMPKCLRTACAG